MTDSSTETDQTCDVLIFYSSKTEPQLLDRYRESITYLKESGIGAEVIDVAEDRSQAREHDVIATPTVIVRDGETEERHLGIVDGLKHVLEDDIYGQSLLHQRGFKEGREFARDHDLQGAGEEQVKDALQAYITTHGMADFELTAFDPQQQVAEGTLTPDPDSDSQGWHAKLEEFLGGVFTEVFDTGVMCAETQCADDGYDHCAFTVDQTE